jgi:hypothetical protein
MITLKLKTIIIISLIACALLSLPLYESFGTSPGTMVQLQTSHVPTQEDYEFYQHTYPRIVRKDLIEMTGGDPGELRPWIFPWYGRGVVGYL